MKKLIALSIFTISLLPFGSLAQDTPTICSSTPSELREYFSTIISVINQVENTPTTNSSSGFGALGEKIAQTGLGSVYLLMLFSIEGIYNNFFPSIKILGHQYYIVRDWSKLINFKKYITKTYLKFASKGILEKPLSQDILNKLNNITQTNKYFVLLPEIQTYKDFIMYIRDNQQIIESLFFSTVTKQNYTAYVSKDYKALNKKHYLDLKKDLKKEYLKNGTDEYNCDSITKNAYKKLKEILDLNKKAKNSIQRFECNYQRLKNVLFGTPFSGSCGNTKLVEGRHIGVKGQIKIQGAGKIIINAITNSKQKVIDTSNFNPSFKFLGKLWNNIKESFDYKTGEANFAKYSETKFINEIKTITTNIKKQKKEASTTLLHVSPEFTQNLTPQFPTLSEKIWIGICTIDTEYPGCNDLPSNTKNKLPQKGIYQNLVETCENQSPFIGRCRYLGF